MERAIVNEGVKVSKSFNGDIISIMGTVGKEISPFMLLKVLVG